MSLISSIIAFINVVDGNIGGAVVALAVGLMIDTIGIDIIGIVAILTTRKEVKNNGK